MPFDTTPDYKPNSQWSEVAVVASQPLWFRNVQTEIAELTKLPDDWDSYGSVAIKQDVANEALKALSHLSRLGMSIPEVFAVPGGGIQFEWSGNSSEMELEIRPNHTIEFLIVDQKDKMREGPIGNNMNELFSLSYWFLNESQSVDNLKVYAQTY